MVNKTLVFACMAALSDVILGCGRQDASDPASWTYLGQTPPGTTPEIFAPGIISKAGFHLHSSLAFSPDGREVYFSKLGPDPENKATICQIKFEGQVWTEIRTAPFSGLYSDDSPVFSPDGTRLYFTSTRPVDEDDESNDLNIWFVKRIGDEWGEPEHAGNIINSEYSDFRLSFAGDGTIYLSSDRNDQEALTFDVFKSHLVDGAYRTPETMGPAITTPVTEQIGYVAPDESYVVFYRYDRRDRDVTGLYISFRGAEGEWSTAVNMGDAFNSPPEAVTQAASLSPDGKYLFFLRREHEAIYWVDATVVENLKPPAD